MTKFVDSGSVSEEELLAGARSGDSESFAALASRCVFIPCALLKAARAAGLEKEDLRQEALASLMKAIHYYDPSRGAGFSTYAAVCVRRHLIAAVRSGFGQKNLAMVGYLPIDEQALASECDPEAAVIEKEELAETRERLFRSLSPLEREVLACYLSGLSYVEISAKTGRTQRSVGNALARARQKLRSEA